MEEGGLKEEDEGRRLQRGVEGFSEIREDLKDGFWGS